MKRYRGSLRILGLLTGLLLGAMVVAQSANPQTVKEINEWKALINDKEFCISYLDWVKEDGTPSMKEIVTPCKIGDAGKEWTEPAGRMNECTVVMAALREDMAGAKYFMIFHAERGKSYAAYLVGLTISKDEIYIYYDGETKKPKLGTTKELIKFATSKCDDSR